MIFGKFENFLENGQITGRMAIPSLCKDVQKSVPSLFHETLGTGGAAGPGCQVVKNILNAPTHEKFQRWILELVRNMVSDKL